MMRSRSASGVVRRVENLHPARRQRAQVDRRAPQTRGIEAKAERRGSAGAGTAHLDAAASRRANQQRRGRANFSLLVERFGAPRAAPSRRPLADDDERVDVRRRLQLFDRGARRAQRIGAQRSRRLARATGESVLENHMIT